MNNGRRNGVRVHRRFLRSARLTRLRGHNGRRGVMGVKDVRVGIDGGRTRME